MLSLELKIYFGSPRNERNKVNEAKRIKTPIRPISHIEPLTKEGNILTKTYKVQKTNIPTNIPTKVSIIWY